MLVTGESYIETTIYKYKGLLMPCVTERYLADDYSTEATQSIKTRRKTIKIQESNMRKINDKHASVSKKKRLFYVARNGLHIYTGYKY